MTVTEGNSGTVDATFTVSLDAPAAAAVTVDYATADGTADRAGATTLAASGTLTFAAGQTTKTVTVLGQRRPLDEANETFFVNLSNPANATIADGQGIGTITDDDPPPTISVNDVTVTEGNAGTVNATFTVTLSTRQRPRRHRRLRHRRRHGHGSGRLLGGDRHADLRRRARRRRRSPSLVNGDLLDEANETFFVNLSNAGQRHDRRRPGPRHDHRRRRAADALRSTTCR